MRALDLACRALGEDLIHSSSRLSVRWLRLLLALLDLQAPRLLLQPARVVALVGHALAAIELQRPLRDVVEEVAVVRHQHDAAGIVLEVALQPGHRLRVQMVGRLVQQQDVGLGQQQLGQRHAPLLAAGELLDLGVARRAAQRIQRLLHLRVEVPQPLRLDLVLQLGHLARRSRRSSWRPARCSGRPAPSSPPRPPWRCPARPWLDRAPAPAAGSRRGCPRPPRPRR